MLTSTHEDNRQLEVLGTETLKIIGESTPSVESVPCIDEFPKNARGKIREATEHSSEVKTKIDKIADNSMKILSKATKSITAGELEIEQKSDFSNYDSSLIQDTDIQLSKINREIDILLSAHDFLKEGKDIFLLLKQLPQNVDESQIFLRSLDSLYAEHNKYGKPQSVLRNISKLYYKFREKDYKINQSKYFESLKVVYAKNLLMFVSRTLNGENKPYTKSGLQQLSNPISNDVLDADNLDSEIEGMENFYNEYYLIAPGVAQKQLGRSFFFQSFRELLSSRSEDFQKITDFGTNELYDYKNERSLNLGEYLSSNLSVQEQNLSEDKNAFLSRKQHLQFLEQLAIVSGRQIYDLVDENFFKKFQFHSTGEFADIACSQYPRELIEMEVNIYTKLSTYLDLIKNSPLDTNDRLQFLEKVVKQMSGASKFPGSLENINRELLNSQDLLYHVALDPNAMESILLNGVVASRKYQLQHLGKAYFASGGMVVTENNITRSMGGRESITDASDYERRRGTDKDINQEEHQSCFSLNKPYMYDNGIAIVFSKASLYAKSQFMDSDGIHLFDPSYDSVNLEGSPGFSVSMLVEPFMILVAEPLKEDFINFVNTEMRSSDVWKDKMQNVEKWINENIIFVPGREPFKSKSERTVTEIAFSEDLGKEVRNKFFEKNKINLKEGRFMPTGNYGDTADREASDLYTYVT